MNRRSPRLAVAFAVLLSISSVLAGAWAGPATTVVETKQKALVTALRANDDKKVDALFDELVDYPAFAEASLGGEWSGRSAAEKAEFTEVLKGLLRRAYKCNLKKIVDYDVRYTGEEPSGDAVRVKTEARKGGGEPIVITFKMAQKAGAWKAQDIENGEESMVKGLRNQFVRALKKDGYAGLIQKMKARLAKGGCDD